jgi:hypothetical protein
MMAATEGGRNPRLVLARTMRSSRSHTVMPSTTCSRIDRGSFSARTISS